MTDQSSGRAYPRPLLPERNPDLIRMADAAREAAKEAKRERARAMDAIVDLLLDRARSRIAVNSLLRIVAEESFPIDFRHPEYHGLTAYEAAAIEVSR